MAVFLSVIIPTLNSSKTIETQLLALSKQSYNREWELIVADNGSTDDSREIIEGYKSCFPSFRMVDASRRRGAAYARNVGVRAARGAAVAFCDADDEVAPDWVAAMARVLHCHDFVASRMDVERLNPAWLSACLNNVQGRELRRAFYPPFLKHAGSSGMGVKRLIHETIGGFDETLAQREDTDYCFRLQLLGVDLHFAANALIHVRYREQSQSLFRQARQWGYYHALLYKRYGRGPLPSLCWNSYIQTWWDLLRGWRSALGAETRPAWMKALGTQIGLLQGSIRFGVPPVCEPAVATSLAAASASIAQN